MKSKVGVGLLSACAAFLLSAAAPVSSVCLTGETVQPTVKLGPLTVDRCFTSYSATEKAAFKDITNYYGRVEMTPSAGISMELDRSFGAGLAKFLGAKEKFTAVITVGIYAKIADEEVLVYEKPIYTVTREENEKTRLSAIIMGGTGIAVSPTFSLDGSNSEIRTRLKVALVNDRKLDAMPIIREGVDIAVKMGGAASLVTAAGEPALLAVTSRIQSTYDSFFSDQQTGDLDTILKFDRANGLKQVRYKIGFRAPNGQNVNVDVALSLSTSESLITTAPPRKDAQNVEWPDVSGLSGARFADRIKLSTRSGPGLSPLLLSTAIDQQGVPQKLEELSIDGVLSEQLVRLDSVNKSCRALQAALQRGPYRLSDSDAQLVLFDELRRGGVFDRYEAKTLPCTKDLVAAWKDRYNLVPQYPVKNRNIPWMAKEVRLRRIAESWDRPTPEFRSYALGDDFATADVPIVAPQGFITNAMVSVDPQGNQSFTIAVEFLADRKKRCFGNFKPTGDAEPWATAFVEFENDPTLYLVTFRFDDRSEFLPNPGPRVESIKIRVATASDKIDFNQSGSCLK